MDILENNSFTHGCTFDNDDFLVPGERIRVERIAYFHPEQVDLSELLSIPAEELKKMHGESAAKEKEFFDTLSFFAGEWEKQGAYTKKLDKVLEYLEMTPVKHTFNEWVHRPNDEHEISNMVYLLHYTLTTKIDFGRRKTMKGKINWHTSWYFCYNPPYRAGGQYPHYIERESDRRFSDEYKAKEHIRGVIEKYADYFTELSPPIPADDQKVFFCNGLLLPGYTVAPHEPTPDELLEFVDGLDLDDESGMNIVPPEAAPERTTKKSGAKKKPSKAR